MVSTTRRTVSVTGRSFEAEGVVSVELRDPARRLLPPWRPGAHIDLCLPSGAIRQYSLCSDPAELSFYRIGVLRVADGRGGSIEVHDSDLVGTEIEMIGPRNHFELGDAEDYLLIAGGIGVTPLLAMARCLNRRGRKWKMIYGGRSRSTMAYVTELAELGGVVDIVPEDELGLPDLDTAIRECGDGTQVYCCGPEPMLQAVQALGREHLPADALHIERFSASQSGASASVRGGSSSIEVELASTGEVLTVPPDRSILDVVLDVLPGTPYSCKAGYCGTCETGVLEGTPDHADDVLSESERARGDTMIICSSRATTPRLKLDL